MPVQNCSAKSEKMIRKTMATPVSVASCGREAKIVFTTALRSSFREITRRGLSARRIRRLLRKPPDPELTKSTTEMPTTMPSSQFQPLLR
jgi:hypothetical protein